MSAYVCVPSEVAVTANENVPSAQTACERELPARLTRTDFPASHSPDSVRLEALFVVDRAEGTKEDGGFGTTVSRVQDTLAAADVFPAASV